MPIGKAIKSPKQYRLMQMKAHGGSSVSIGPSSSVAQKLLGETSSYNKKRLARGRNSR